MIYAPSELKAVKLRDVPVGTVIKLTHVANIPVAIKLADFDGCSSWILALDGEYAFHAIPWSEDSDIATTLCKPDAIRFKLGEPSWKTNHNTAGVLTLHAGGAFIASIKKNGQPNGAKVDVASWGFAKVFNSDDGCALYPNWEMGHIDAKHDFIPVFSRT